MKRENDYHPLASGAKASAADVVESGDMAENLRSIHMNRETQ